MVAGRRTADEESPGRTKEKSPPMSNCSTSRLLLRNRLKISIRGIQKTENYPGSIIYPSKHYVTTTLQCVVALFGQKRHIR